MRRIRGKKQQLSSAGLHSLRDEYTRTIEPARALATETLPLEREFKAEGQRLKACYGLAPAKIELMWQTAPPRVPIPSPAA